MFKLKAIAEASTKLDEIDRFSGNTALAGAAIGGQLTAVQYLLSRGADPNQRLSRNRTILSEAVSSGSIEILQTLIAAGASVDAHWDEGTALHCAAYLDDEGSLVELLLEKGASTSELDKRGNTPLHIAASQGHVKVCRLLLANGAVVNARQDHVSRHHVREHDGPLPDWTPLQKAAAGGHVDVAALLIEHGADVNTRDHWNKTPLMRIIDFDSCNPDAATQLAAILLTAGADPELRCSKGKTAVERCAAQPAKAGVLEVIRTWEPTE